MIHSRVTTALKSLGAGRFEGLAWSFAAVPDSVGDVLLPSALEAAAKAAPWPVLVEHAGEPVGEIELAQVSAAGLTVAGRVDPASDAYQRMRSGELAGLSIAFRGESETSGPVRIFTAAQLAEVSLCRAPVNAGARVTTVKSWRELRTEVELQTLLKSTGMPGRLAQKCAAAAWPILQKSDEPGDDVLQALRRLANA